LYVVNIDDLRSDRTVGVQVRLVPKRSHSGASRSSSMAAPSNSDTASPLDLSADLQTNNSLLGASEFVCHSSLLR
jgi:hypothetical protein